MKKKATKTATKQKPLKINGSLNDVLLASVGKFKSKEETLKNNFMEDISIALKAINKIINDYIDSDIRDNIKVAAKTTKNQIDITFNPTISEDIREELKGKIEAWKNKGHFKITIGYHG